MRKCAGKGMIVELFDLRLSDFIYITFEPRVESLVVSTQVTRSDSSTIEDKIARKTRKIWENRHDGIFRVLKYSRQQLFAESVPDLLR